MLIGVDLDGTIDAYPREMQSMMSALRAAGHQVHVITGCDSQATDSELARKAQYLASLGLGECYDELVLISGPESQVAQRKARYLKSVGGKVLIDNDQANCAAANAQGVFALLSFGTRQ